MRIKILKRHELEYIFSMFQGGLYTGLILTVLLAIWFRFTHFKAPTIERTAMGFIAFVLGCPAIAILQIYCGRLVCWTMQDRRRGESPPRIDR